jgi:quercetin dioxygenase-like cupin family protein
MKSLLIALAMLIPVLATAAEPVIDNERVSVWDTEAPLPPAAHDFVAVSLAHPGTAHFGHAGERPGQAAERTIVIELKDHPLAPLPQPAGVPNAFPRAHAVQLLANGRVIVWSYRWNPGEPTPMHFHDKDAVVVYEEDGTLQSTAADGAVVVNHYRAGDVRFNARGRVHTERVTDGTERAVITELR